MQVDLTPPAPRQRLEVTSRDGTRIAVEVHGPERAPTVVLAHGWVCSTEFWAPVIRRLSIEMRVVAYDQRGHGRSEKPRRGGSGISAEALADDLAAVISATVPARRQAILVGHSMGAMSIVALAGRHYDLLKRSVAAALLASTGVDELAGRVDLLTPRGRLAGGVPDHVARAVQFFVRGGLADSLLLHALPPPVARSAVRHITLSPTATADQTAFCTDIILSCPRTTHHGFARLLNSLDLSQEVQRLDVPTMVVVGTADRLTPPWHAHRLAERVPMGLGVVEVPDAGHMTPVQAPDVITAVVLSLAEDYLPIQQPTGRRAPAPRLEPPGETRAPTRRQAAG